MGFKLVLVWYLFFPKKLHHLGTFIMRISHFLISIWHGCLTIFSFQYYSYGSILHARTYIHKQSHPRINKFHNGSYPNNKLGIQRFSDFGVPIEKYQYLINIILIPMSVAL